jgi:hypothetical protein
VRVLAVRHIGHEGVNIENAFEHGGSRLLLTSAGIKNKSIRDALVGLLGKPIGESNALCIPTAAYARPGGAGHAWRLISGRDPFCATGCVSRLGRIERREHGDGPRHRGVLRPLAAAHRWR